MHVRVTGNEIWVMKRFPVLGDILLTYDEATRREDVVSVQAVTEEGYEIDDWCGGCSLLRRSDIAIIQS